MADPDATADFDFDALVGDILENPERLLSADLTAEQVLELQKRLNPYAGIAGPPPAPERKRVAACSYTNLREDYLRRFTATSLVGFLFQMLKEWEVPAERRRWVPAAAAARPEADFAAFEPARLAELAAAAADVAKAAAEAAAEVAAAKRAAAEAELMAAEPAADLAGAKAAGDAAAAARMSAAAAAEKAAGLLYAATHAAHRLGGEATDRLRAAADAGLAFPTVREVLGKFPLPPPASSLEAPPALAKQIVEDFVSHWLEFDPAVHVRAGHNAAAVQAALAEKAVGGGAAVVDAADPAHLTVAALRDAPVAPAPAHAEALAKISADPRTKSALLALLREPDLADAAAAALADEASREAFLHYLGPVAADSAARPAAEVVPPQDTFHRWAYYTEVNYEELRTVTEALYPERPDLDWAIALWDVFEGDAKAVDAAFDKHCQRYQDEVPSAIKSLEFGGWSLLGDFKENRKKIQFYNSHTDILKRILDRHADDKRIGAELMRNRVRQAKAKNIAEAGPDAAGLVAYKRNQAEKGQALGGKGAEKVISPEEMRRLEKAGGSVKAAQELEFLEGLERTIGLLTTAQQSRALTLAETEELARARGALPRAKEMADVPDDAIQVDVFTNDTKNGTFGRSAFFTKADDAEAPPAAGPMGRRPAAGALEAAAASAHPAAQMSLAPYAAEYLAAVNAAERAP